MNPRQLVRMYDKLKPWERIPLLIAANSRKDETEARRLFDASPIRTWRFAEHLLDEHSLNVIALMFVGEQLEAAAGYFFASCQVDDSSDADSEQWSFIADACVFFFTMNGDAWRRFCDELGIDPNALTTANHHGWVLQLCDVYLPAVAPTAEAMHDSFRRAGQEPPPLVTSDELLESWRHLLRLTTHNKPPSLREAAAIVEP